MLVMGISMLSTLSSGTWLGAATHCSRAEKTYMDDDISRYRSDLAASLSSILPPS